MSGGLSIEMWRAEDGDLATSRALQERVFEELAWEPALDPREVAVLIRDRTVTLSGCVHSLLEKVAAERAAGRVQGMVHVQNDILVMPTLTSDAAIANAVRTALAADALLGAFEISVDVCDGWVEMTGRVRTAYARRTAEVVVGRLNGVSGITNLLTIDTGPAVVGLAARANEAVRRCGAQAARHLRLEVSGIAIIVRGSTRSLAERDCALHALWDIPGVGAVIDETYVTG
jgi:osmotically-inducible protein OsmY